MFELDRAVVRAALAWYRRQKRANIAPPRVDSGFIYGEGVLWKACETLDQAEKDARKLSKAEGRKA